MLIQSTFPLLTVFLIKELIDAVTFAQSSQQGATGNYVVLLVVFTGLVFFLNALADASRNYILQVQRQQFFDFIFEKIHQKTTSVNIEFFENDEYYNLFSRTLNNADKRPLDIVNNTFSFFQNSISIISLGILIISLHWAIFVLLALAALPLGYVQWRNTNKLYQWYKSHTRDERKIWDVNDVLTNAYFATEMRLFDLSSFFRKVFSSLRNKIRTGFFNISRQNLFLEGGAQLFTVLAIFSVLGLVSVQAAQGAFTVGVLAMFILAIQKGISLFTELFRNAARVYEDSLYVVYMIDFLNLKNKIPENKDGLNFPSPIQKGIVFKNVSFSYPNSSKKALDNISLEIPSGSTIALVGANGSGKSTLIKLLCRLYEANSGEILIDGTNIKDFSEIELRKNISALFQNFCRYNLTASENIWFGDTQKPVFDAEIRNAAKKAKVHELLKGLSKGYGTVLGKIYEDSQEVSVGEWQKIALARAFYKDSQVIILDEPSSAMDPETEYEIFKLFKEITKGKTSIMISHRLSTVKMADYIYVMEKERIVESGTHEQLLKSGGIYHSMFHKQSETFFEKGLI